MPDNNVRLQNLRDFTVQIRRADNDAIVGTGIAVSMDGKIVTCRHVVEAVGIDPCNANGAEVGIYFPQARGGEEKKRRAKIGAYFSLHDDDMVLLELIEGAAPLSPEQIAILGMADKSEGNPFRTYGYSPIGTYPATRGDGIILGTVESPVDRNLQVDPIQLKSRDIAAGMSGAAVLDVTRNLVVGLVAERFYSPGLVQDDIGYGVDSKVLTFDPFDFVLRGEALALKPAPEFRLDKDLSSQAIEFALLAIKQRKPADKFSWNSAPTILPEWTGRDELLAQITSDWNNPHKHVTGLIGFGGEGKSSLARKWVETLNLQPANLPTGIFWWGFYENRSVDEFLEAALNYLSGGRIDSRQVPSSSLRAQIIGAMLGTGRYLFVLDGLEVMQHQDGDQYGLLTSNDLRDLLTYFACPDNQSFCLITSRAPLLDLMDYTTYIHRDVDRLSEADGIALLKKLGVKPSPVIGSPTGVLREGQGEGELAKIVSDWDGHALTISLLGSYLAEKHNGNIARLADIPIPTADEPRYERVHRVLRRYDEHLTEAEREFLKLFSVFRLPVKESAFEKVFEPLLKQKPKGIVARLFSTKTNATNPDSRISNIVNRLANYRLIRHNEQEKSYTTHPLIRNHYFTIFTKGDSAQRNDTHIKIKEYYLSIAGETLQYPTLDDLKPLIEAVHHACQADYYSDAFNYYYFTIQKEKRAVLTYELIANQTILNILVEFFPNGDITKKLPLSYSNSRLINMRELILADIGYSLTKLGRTEDGLLLLESSLSDVGDSVEQHISNSSRTYTNIAATQMNMGKLKDSLISIDKAFLAAKKVSEPTMISASLCRKGWILHLVGDILVAEQMFREVVQLRLNLSMNGSVFWADHLRRSKNSSEVSAYTTQLLNFSINNRWLDITSQCYRILGDADSDLGQHASAHNHYDSALKNARSISDRVVLIEALLARGRWQAKHMKNANDAFNDLNEALNYAVESGYRIYEADIRVALGWAWLADPTPRPPSQIGKGESLVKARAEAERALQMSNEMGYHWGKVDAKEVLEKIRE